MLTNTAWVAGSQVVAKAATLVWTVVAAQRLGADGFGGFSLALATALVLATFSQWGFTSLLVQRSSVEKDSLSRRCAETLVWQGGIALVLVAASSAVFAVATRDAELVVTFALVQLAVSCDTASSTSRSAASVLHRQGWTSLALVAQRLVAVVLIVLALAETASLLALAVAFAVASVAGLGLHLLILVRLGVRPSPRLVTWEGMRALWSGSSRMGISTLLGTLLFQIGFIILGLVGGTAEVGSYAAAHKLFDTVLFLSYALVAAAFPLMSEVAGGRRLAELTEGAFGLLAVVYVPYAAVAVVSAPEVVDLVFGPSYVADAAPVLRWLAPAPLLFGLTYVGGTALVSATRARELLLASAVALAVAVCLGVVLVPRVGAEGAAAALLAALVVEALVVIGALRAAVGVWPRVGAQVVQPMLASAATVPVLVVLRGSVLVGLAVAAAVYLVVWVALTRWRPPVWFAMVGRGPARSASQGTGEEAGGDGVLLGGAPAHEQEPRADVDDAAAGELEQQRER